MNLTSVESGEFHVTANVDEVLIVYNLRGAIAMMVYDPVAKGRRASSLPLA